MLEEHLEYVDDRTRLEQFREAFACVIRPGDRVADVGCGSGVLGLMCLHAGAAQVYAIDSTDMIEVARETLTRAYPNGSHLFIRGLSQRIELPDRVDVAICDHVGYFGFDYGVVDLLQDARRRFLKPGGQVIPAKIKLRLGAIESQKCRDKVNGWVADGVPPELHWLRHHGVNQKYAFQLTRQELLCEEAELGCIDLQQDNPEFYTWNAEMRIIRDGVMHGLAGWFECELAEGVWMTNSPVSQRAIRRPQAFLPIDDAVEVKTGELVKATIMARPKDDLIAWTVEFPANGRRFSHSTWHGMFLAQDARIRADPMRCPRLSGEGRARVIVLGYCDGQRSIQEIEQAVLRDYPDLFPSQEEISRFVSHVLGRDTE